MGLGVAVLGAEHVATAAAEAVGQIHLLPALTCTTAVQLYCWVVFSNTTVVFSSTAG